MANTASVSVPRDLSKIKTKVIFNLTQRQLLFFGSGALVGVPLFFLLRDQIGQSPAALLMILAMLPFFFFALYEKNGQPLEKHLRNMIQVCFLRPKERPYCTNNLYDLLRRQDALDREVYAIVSGKKTQSRRQKANRAGHRKGQKEQ